MENVPDTKADAHGHHARYNQATSHALLSSPLVLVLFVSNRARERIYDRQAVDHVEQFIRTGTELLPLVQQHRVALRSLSAVYIHSLKSTPDRNRPSAESAAQTRAP